MTDATKYSVIMSDLNKSKVGGPESEYMSIKVASLQHHKNNLKLTNFN
jgi:hypothetical protein